MRRDVPSLGRVEGEGQGGDKEGRTLVVVALKAGDEKACPLRFHRVEWSG